MADAKEEKALKKKGGIGWFGIVLGLALSGAFLLPTTMIFVAGMLPTLIMAMMDSSPDRRGALAIGILNFAGVLPSMIMLWRQGHTTDTAMRILTDPTNWLVILGAAGAASVIYIYVPKSVALFASLRAQSEISARRALQKKLVERWGEQVSSSKNLGELVKE